MSWKTMSEQQRKNLQDHFKAALVVDELTERHQAGTSRCDLSDLYRSLMSPTGSLTVEQKTALLADPRLRRDFAAMLSSLSCFQADQAAAADDGSLSDRSGPGFHISLRSTQRRSTEIYLIIQLDRPELEGQDLLLVGVGQQGEYAQLLLPSTGASGRQLLVAESAGIVSLLRNYASELYVLTACTE